MDVRRMLAVGQWTANFNRQTQQRVCRALPPATLLLLMSLSSVGCGLSQQNKAYVQSMNAEKLAMEDIIYEQEFLIDKMRRKLRQLRDRSTVGSGLNDNASPASNEEEDEGFSPPQIDGPGDPPEFTPPTIVPGDPVRPEDVNPGMASRAPARGLEVRRPVSDHDVDHVVINSSLTGGRNLDNAPGDDALEIGLEPRDRQGRYVPLPRAISIVVLDPALAGDGARIARWDFTQKDVEVAMQNVNNRAIRLEAVWPKRPPRHSRLRLYARYITQDGRKLEANQMVHVDVAGSYSARWTPRDRGDSSSRATTAVAREPVRSAGLVPWGPTRPAE